MSGATVIISPASAALTEYETFFPTTENPLSEGGIWLNGDTPGTMPFGNVQVTSGKAYADRFCVAGVNDYEDGLAILDTAFIAVTADQYAECTLHVTGGYTPPDSHEVELWVRGTYNAGGPDYFSGYEILIPFGGIGVQIIKQDGTYGGFTVLTNTGVGWASPFADGDKMRVEITGTSIQVFKWVAGAWALGGECTDATFATGQPGMGFFIRPGTGADATKYCMTRWKGGNL